MIDDKQEISIVHIMKNPTKYTVGLLHPVYISIVGYVPYDYMIHYNHNMYICTCIYIYSPITSPCYLHYIPIK